MKLTGRARGPGPVASRLHVNVATRGYGTARWLQSGMVLVLLVSVAYGGWSWTEARRLAGETARYADSIARVQALNRSFSAALVQDGLTRRQTEIDAVYRRVEFANLLTRKRSFSWTRLLNRLEDAIPARTSVQSVRLDFRESAVNLKGRAKTLGDLNALVDSLDRHDAFHRVRIMNHRFQEVEEESPSTRSVKPAVRTNKPRKHQVVEFELSVGYHTQQ